MYQADHKSHLHEEMPASHEALERKRKTRSIEECQVMVAVRARDADKVR